MATVIGAIEIEMIMMKTAMAFAESSSADGVSMAPPELVLERCFAAKMVHRGKMVFGFCTKWTGIIIIMDDFVMSESSVVVLSIMVANNDKRRDERKRALNGLSSLSSDAMSMRVMGNIGLVGGACPRACFHCETKKTTTEEQTNRHANRLQGGRAEYR